MTNQLGHVVGSEPYPWPYDAPVAAARVALVVAGWDRHWYARTVQPDATARRVARLADAIASHGGHVVAIAHPDRSGQVAEALPLDGAVTLEAGGIDGFAGGPLELHLRRRHVSHLLIAGHGFEASVHSTLRSANDRGFECLAVVDACSPLDASLVTQSISMIHMSGGIFGATGTTDAVAAALGNSSDAAPPALSSTRRI